MNTNQLASILAHETELPLNVATSVVINYASGMHNVLTNKQRVTMPGFGTITFQENSTEIQLQLTKAFLAHFDSVVSEGDPVKQPTTDPLTSADIQSWLSAIGAANLRYSKNSERTALPPGLMAFHELWRINDAKQVKAVFQATQKLIIGLILCREPIVLDHFLHIDYEPQSPTTAKKRKATKRLRPVLKSFQCLRT